MKNPTKQISQHVDEALSLALQYVEEQARKILSEHPNLDEFVMAMGDCTFSTFANENLGLEDRSYFASLRRFIWAWDDILGITGNPMRFTATGPVCHNW